MAAEATHELADVGNQLLLATRKTHVRDLQLQGALDSRVVIEQAKGC